MLPMLGLLGEVYRGRHDDAREVYRALAPRLEKLFPETFEWKHETNEGEAIVADSAGRDGPGRRLDV